VRTEVGVGDTWAMSEEAIEVVRRIYARPLLLDPELLTALAAVASSETEFDFTDAYPDGKVVRGVDGVRRIAANWPWGDLHFEPERLVEVDDERVLVFVRATATGVGSGIPVERRTAHECTFTAGQLVRFKVYSDRDDALRAAGRARATYENVRRGR
jgi:ketosteroid isomerase-like protein